MPGQKPRHTLLGAIVSPAGQTGGPPVPPYRRSLAYSILFVKRHKGLPGRETFKQWGGARKKKAGRELEGRKWDEVPVRASVLAL